MQNIRIIPRLDIKGKNVIKGIHLECLRVVGDPEQMATEYYKDGADELIYMDVVASLYGRNNLLRIVERAAQNIFIPMTVGGGIRSINDIQKLLRSGADKVAINTHATKHPEFISEAAKAFGSQCIVGSIEAKKVGEGNFEAYTDNGRVVTGLNAVTWATRLAELGAGELLVTSIDKEGTTKGYDIELMRSIAPHVSIPVIASGGAGSAKDVLNVIKEGKVDAVSLADVFHYKKQNIKDVKAFLERHDVSVRV